MTSKVAVIGAGSWGTTVASLACANVATTLWARRDELATRIATDHRNDQYLPGVALPPLLQATSSMAEAVEGCNLVAMAVPSQGFRSVLETVALHLSPSVPVVSLCKGLESGTLKRMSEVVADVLPGHPVAVLTGPNLARELLAGHPTATVVAGPDHGIAELLRHALSNPALRLYVNGDLVGCEICGVAKNVMAIAAGMASGLGFGDNTKAALVTRGLMEMARLGLALGADPLTFSGLAGMGDLVATCWSRQSRNFMVGVGLGQGRSIGELTSSATVAEGVRSSTSVLALGRRLGVELPITEVVVGVCHEGRDVRDSVRLLMDRTLRDEMHGLSA